MSLLCCEVHGQAGGMPYVSLALANYINNKDYIDQSLIKSVHVVFNDSGETLFERYYFFIKDEFRTLKLDCDYVVDDENDEEKLGKLLSGHLGMTCIKCFKEYMDMVKYEYKL